MPSRHYNDKQIGTLVPLSALQSSKLSLKECGTFAVGIPFLNWLQATNQSIWQLLPLHQTQLESGSASRHVPSPYKGYGIGLDPKYLPTTWDQRTPTRKELSVFVSQEQEWITDYALFCALRDHYHTDDWREWDEDIRCHEPKTVTRWSEKLAEEIEEHVKLQWKLHQAFAVMKEQASLSHIKLSGDMPFYLSVCSPLVWAHQRVFELGKAGDMNIVSGVTDFPPSFFGRQVWGHPLYAWNTQQNVEEIVALWKLRIRYLSTLYDMLRFDYAEAFYHYGAMNISREEEDKNHAGPGASVFEPLVRYARNNGLFVFVEDSGTKTIEMHASLRKLHCPSLIIFPFASKVSHYPQHSVAFTTTHDTKTLLGFVESLDDDQKNQLAMDAECAYDSDDTIFVKNLRSAVLSSPAQMVIVPIQDWLRTTERMNIPGTEKVTGDQNWKYQVHIPIEEFPASHEE